MRVLLVHTCGVEGSVAVADTEAKSPICAAATLPARTFSEGLMPAVRQILAAAAWEVRDIEAVGVVHGPGSFTGVRTGLSVGKGLCEALGIPLAGVSRLALLARAAGRQGRVHAVLDAGRGEFYYGLFQEGSPAIEALMGADELQERVRGGRIVVCEEKVRTALQALGLDAEQVPEPSAADAVGLMLEGLAQGFEGVFGDANYLRRTDGEIFAKAKVKG